MEGETRPGSRSWRSRIGEGAWTLLHRSGLLATGRAARRRLGLGATRVLCYHRVAVSPRPMDLSADRFASHLAHLARRYRFVAPEEIVRALADGRPLPRDGVALTFDDGYADLLRTVLPLLGRGGIPAAVFVLTADLPDPGQLWLDRIAGTPAAADRGALARRPARERSAVLAAAPPPGSPPPPLLDAAGVRELRDRGIAIGSHTRTHPHLPSLTDAEVRRELEGSREELAEVLGSPPELLAWPWGAVDDRTAGLARRAGYRAAFATGGGAVRPGANPFSIPRLHVPGDAGVARLACEAAGLIPRLRGVR